MSVTTALANAPFIEIINLQTFRGIWPLRGSKTSKWKTICFPWSLCSMQVRMRKSSRKHRARTTSGETARGRNFQVYLKPVYICATVCMCTRPSDMSFPIQSVLAIRRNVVVQEARESKPHGDATSGLYTVLTFPLKPFALSMHDLRRTSGCITRDSVGSTSGGER